jgi:hypothetical protein
VRGERQPARTSGSLRGGLAAALLVALALLPGSAAPAAAAECPNEARRAEQGAPAQALPDCRAYELVSPGATIPLDSRPGRSSVSGDAFTYRAKQPAPDAATSSYYYLAGRSPSGWSIQSVGPQAEAAARFEEECEQSVYFSPDLSRNIDEEGWFSPGSAHCKRSQEVLVPGEPRLYRNVFLHEIAGDSYQLLNLTPAGVPPANAKFEDASDDFSHIVFGEEAKLTPEAPAGYDYYLWSGGSLRLATVLPDGTPVAGQLAEAAGQAGSGVNGFAPITGAVSADGRRILFYAGNGLYLRLNADQPQGPAGSCSGATLGCTVQVDRSTGIGASGGGIFGLASENGGRVFFTDESRLTPDSTTSAGKADLYEYEVASEALTDLTVNGTESADVRGVLGGADDGSRIYFVANGVLAPGASPGNCSGGEAAGQACNLYVLDEGAIAFVARLPRADRFIWREEIPITSRKPGFVWSQVSPSGRYLGLSSIASLTGYDNRNPGGEFREREIFLYDAESGQLSCASCNPDGSRPSNSTALETSVQYGPTSEMRPRWMTRSVLDDGAVFFTSREALLPADTNKFEDVYEFEAGRLYLISDGSYPGPSRFLDASAGGRDVFFRTAQTLVPGDSDSHNVSVYDARGGGGFAEPGPAPPACSDEDSCRGEVAAAPAGPAAATAAPGGEETRPRRHPRRCRKQARQKRRACRARKQRPARAHRDHGRPGRQRGGQR